MKKIQIIHNPTAGNGEHSRKDLLELVSNSGYEYHYISTEDEEWQNFPDKNCDLIVMAGGDGTVRKIAGELLKNNLGRQIPLYLLPLGTANNIAHTLGLSEKKEMAGLQELSAIQPKNFDCGSISGYGNESFFVESMGFGIFPKLISEMKKNTIENEDPERKLERTLKELLEIVKNFKPQEAKLKLDGMTIKGSFFLVEVMNIKFLGPNLKFAPNANPGDGYLDLVLIPAGKKSQLEDYLEQLIEGKKEDNNSLDFINTMRVKTLDIRWKGSSVHVDDIYSNDYTGEKIKLKVIPGAFQFLNM